MIWLKKDLDRSERLTLERRADGQLWADLDGEERTVRVHRCFPWSEPGRFVSLRDTDNEEFALVESVDELGTESSRVLAEALVEAGFVLEVTGITDVDEEVEILGHGLLEILPSDRDPARDGRLQRAAEHAVQLPRLDLADVGSDEGDIVTHEDVPDREIPRGEHAASAADPAVQLAGHAALVSVSQGRLDIAHGDDEIGELIDF